MVRVGAFRLQDERRYNWLSIEGNPDGTESSSPEKHFCTGKMAIGLLVLFRGVI